jgi:hypothetical protein
LGTGKSLRLLPIAEKPNTRIVPTFAETEQIRFDGFVNCFEQLT